MSERIIALDVGDVRIGLAVSDPTRTIAQPLETYTRVGYGPDSRYIRTLCDRYGTDEVLLGLPLNMDGSWVHRLKKPRHLAMCWPQRVCAFFIPDERLTSVTAERVLLEGNLRRRERKRHVDKIAAAVILEQWLRRQTERK